MENATERRKHCTRHATLKRSIKLKCFTVVCYITIVHLKCPDNFMKYCLIIFLRFDIIVIFEDLIFQFFANIEYNFRIVLIFEILIVKNKKLLHHTYQEINYFTISFRSPFTELSIAFAPCNFIRVGQTTA